MWHGVDFPSLAGRVKFRANPLDSCNLSFYFMYLQMIASPNFSLPSLDPSTRFREGAVATA
jgi:hypothetical protein